jgi:hypothetical protein
MFSTILLCVLCNPWPTLSPDQAKHHHAWPRLAPTWHYAVPDQAKPDQAKPVPDQTKPDQAKSACGGGACGTYQTGPFRLLRWRIR